MTSTSVVPRSATSPPGIAAGCAGWPSRSRRSWSPARSSGSRIHSDRRPRTPRHRPGDDRDRGQQRQPLGLGRLVDGRGAELRHLRHRHRRERRSWRHRDDGSGPRDDRRLRPAEPARDRPGEPRRRPGAAGDDKAGPDQATKASARTPSARPSSSSRRRSQSLSDTSAKNALSISQANARLERRPRRPWRTTRRPCRSVLAQIAKDQAAVTSATSALSAAQAQGDALAPPGAEPGQLGEPRGDHREARLRPQDRPGHGRPDRRRQGRGRLGPAGADDAPAERRHDHGADRRHRHGREPQGRPDGVRQLGRTPSSSSHAARPARSRSWTSTRCRSPARRPRPTSRSSRWTSRRRSPRRPSATRPPSARSAR